MNYLNRSIYYESENEAPRILNFLTLPSDVSLRVCTDLFLPADFSILFFDTGYYELLTTSLFFHKLARL